jgi:hypothetical protein
LTKNYQFLHLVLSTIQCGRGICSVMCSLITKEKLVQVFKKCAVLRSHLKSKTNLHPRPNIKLGMGYFTLLMYKTVINRGYKSCLLFASYCKSASPINEFFLVKIHTNWEKKIL